MTQLSMFSPPVWTVAQITRYVRELFEDDETLQDIWVQGEVSNLSRPGSGHIYFTIKDNTSSLKCVMWKSVAARQISIPRDGEAVEIHGNINIYEAAGQYQLYVDKIRPAGMGDLFQEFLRLKARLEAEGIFDDRRKRPLPRWPHTIGVITSPTGAALRDILNTIQRRFPIVKVILAPTLVQGSEAPAGIIQALRTMDNQIHPDVIIIARGGGTIEDLWAFNDEMVARAIAASQAPVISGIGHETDFTIADFVSDVRAPTPTAAAELATPNRAEIIPELAKIGNRLTSTVHAKFMNLRWLLKSENNQLSLLSPQSRLHSNRQRLDEYATRISLTLAHLLELNRVHLRNHDQRLAALNPAAILARGYALVQKSDGTIVYQKQQIDVGEVLSVQVSDGRFGAQVIENEPEKSGN